MSAKTDEIIEVLKTKDNLIKMMLSEIKKLRGVCFEYHKYYGNLSYNVDSTIMFDSDVFTRKISSGHGFIELINREEKGISIQTRYEEILKTIDKLEK